MKQAYAYVILGALSFLLATGAVLISLHEIDVNDHKFCQVVTGVTGTKVSKPADPKAHKDLEQQWEWYQRFIQLGNSLGC